MTVISEAFVNQYANTLNNQQFNKERNQCSSCSVVLATSAWMIDSSCTRHCNLIYSCGGIKPVNRLTSGCCHSIHKPFRHPCPFCVN